MSDEQQPEVMRPIPDGGLKDAMPGWLKRPPAWRSMPSAEERHERTLPEPDTSEIDPRTLVDVSDLPQWLQAIASRGELPLPEPDESVGHALEQIQAASARSKEQPSSTHPAPAADTTDEATEIAEVVEPPKAQEVGLLSDEPATSLPPTPGASRPSYLLWGLIASVVIIMLLVIAVLYLL